VPVVDVTGAGDALAAGLCAGLLRHAGDLDAAARLGLDLAALTLQTVDSVHPELTPDFLRNR
jgi:pseudouridine kinase